MQSVLLLLVSLICALADNSWETVNLDIAMKGSQVLELTESSLPLAAQEHPLLVVWFYAPWCKQCKLLRDAFEEAATTGVAGVKFARINCDKYKTVKEVCRMRMPILQYSGAC